MYLKNFRKIRLQSSVTRLWIVCSRLWLVCSFGNAYFFGLFVDMNFLEAHVRYFVQIAALFFETPDHIEHLWTATSAYGSAPYPQSKKKMRQKHFDGNCKDIQKTFDI